MDDDDGGEKENRTRPVYVYLKSNLKLFLFFSHHRMTERRQEHKKTEQYTKVKERERENGICPLL
jgi:hypothetical protein